MSPAKPVPNNNIVLGSGMALVLFRVVGRVEVEKLEMIVAPDPKMESTE